MPHLVIGDDLPLLGIEQPVALFETRDHALNGVGEVAHCDSLASAAGRQERGFVDEIGEIGAGESRRQRRHRLRSQRGNLRMNAVIRLGRSRSEKPTVRGGRAKNADYRQREYLTEAEIEKLLTTAGNSRNPV